MKKIKEIKKKLKEIEPLLREKFKIKEIGIFGSYVRGEENKESDLDVLVEFEREAKTFDNYMDLKFFLEEIFSKKVDLIISGALKEGIKERIMEEVKYAEGL